jgi:uncharacterized membrane protein
MLPTVASRACGPAGLVELRLHHVPHLATRDVHVIASQVNATAERRAGQPGAPPYRVLLAPHIRHQQADVLEEAGIGYLDLAGKAHVDLPGLHVHVEGKRLQRAADTTVAITPGWVRFVLALLVRPDLAQARYRTVAEQAGLALGAVPRYRHDLERRGFLEGKGGRARLAVLAIDMVWLGLVARGFYRKHLDFLLRTNSNWPAAILFYLLFVLGLLVFVVVPSLRGSSTRKVLILGALFGLVSYATYDLTNLATVRNWPWIVTAVDLLWGGFLAATVSDLGLLVGRWLA